MRGDTEGMPSHVRGGILVGLCIVLSAALAVLLILTYHSVGVLAALIAVAALFLGVLGTVVAVRHQ